jgi:hypothetical protein
MNVLFAVSSLALLSAPPQSPDVNYLPAALHEQLACAPQMLPSAPPAGIRVIGNDQPGRTLFGTHDGIIIGAGSAQGIKVGQQFFVRRLVKDQFIGGDTAASGAVSVHTAGWVTAVDVREKESIAQVTHACDGIINGDYLEAYVDPADPPSAVQGEPDFEHAGRIVMGDERRQMGSAGTLMVVDKGSDADVRPGQTVTIFRDTMEGGGPVSGVGRATVVSVRPESAILRIDSTRDAIFIGDRVAINRITR